MFKRKKGFEETAPEEESVVETSAVPPAEPTPATNPWVKVAELLESAHKHARSNGALSIAEFSELRSKIEALKPS